MKTPAGRECKHFYEDYFRGREIQECRLIKTNPESMRWKPSDCAKCPVPAILDANASRDMELKLSIERRILGFGRKPVIKAHCLRHDIPIVDPFVGCPKCAESNAGLDLFRKALEDKHD